MKKFLIAFSLYWVAVVLIYFMSAFDSAYSEKLYSTYEVAALPMTAITGNIGIALEGKHGLTPLIFIARILLDLAIPALVDLGLIIGALFVWKKLRPKGSDSSAAVSDN